MFLFNQVQINSIQNIHVESVLKDWFGFNTNGKKNSINILAPYSQRNLNEEEMDAFDFDFNYSINPITVGLRLEYKNIIYQSNDYNRVGPRRCNYAIRFKGENPVNYGLIKYFLVINGAFLVALNELVIKENVLDKIKGRASVALTDLKRSGALNRFFSVAQLNNYLIFISPSEILTKCVICKVANGSYLISQFDLENDYN